MAAISQLIRKRGTVTNFASFLTPINADCQSGAAISEKTILDFKARLAKFKFIYSEFETIQIEIESICDLDVLDAQYKERSDFDNNFYTALATTQYIINKPQSPVVSQASVQSSENMSNTSAATEVVGIVTANTVNASAANEINASSVITSSLKRIGFRFKTIN